MSNRTARPVLCRDASDVPAMEELIEVVKQHKVIYDVQCTQYKGHAKRSAAWEQIGKQLNKTPDKCRDDWTKLRNAYVNAIKRRKPKHGSTSITTPWKYEAELSFLRPFMQSRPCKTKLMETDTDVPSRETDTESDFQRETSATRSATPDSECSHLRPRKKNLQDLYDLMASHDLKQQQTRVSDETDLFFLSMSKSLKKLPIQEQNRIKMDLHKAISEAELRLFGTEDPSVAIEIKESEFSQTPELSDSIKKETIW